MCGLLKFAILKFCLGVNVIGDVFAETPPLAFI